MKKRICGTTCAFVHILIEDRGRYLLVQEAKPDIGCPWCYPAGGVEPGESIIQAVVREAMEETGLVVEPCHLMRIWHSIPQERGVRPPDPELWVFVVVAKVRGGELKTVADEHSLRAAWFRPDEIENLTLRWPGVWEMIEMHRGGAPLLPIDAYVVTASRTTRYQGAIVREHRILLIKHRRHLDGHEYWVLPGGGREPGESEEACVRREMREETYLDVRVERILLDEPAHPDDPYRQLKTYLCVPIAGHAQPGYEPEPDAAQAYAISEVGWFDLRDETAWDPLAVHNPFTYPQLRRIREALGYLPPRT